MDSDNNPSSLISSRIVEDDGHSKKHRYPIGEVVTVDISISQPGLEDDGVSIELKGTCTLYVVAHIRDCDGAPLYILSDIPVVFPVGSLPFSRERMVYKEFSKVIESGYGEESLRSTGRHKELHQNARGWLMPS